MAKAFILLNKRLDLLTSHGLGLFLAFFPGQDLRLFTIELFLVVYLLEPKKFFLRIQGHILKVIIQEVVIKEWILAETLKHAIHLSIDLGVPTWSRSKR